jgi:two-component sensor histidine kinase
VTVADSRGVIIARQPYFDQFIGTKIPDAFMRLVNGTAPGVETVTSQDGTVRVLGYIPSSLPPAVGLYVSAGLSAEASYVAVNRAAKVGALLTVGGALLTLAVTWFAGRRVFVEPLERLQDVLRRWRAGDRAARSGFDGEAGELGALAAALDAMMREVAESQAQRDLLAQELGHRVKNTLATVQAIANSTLNKPQPAKDMLPDFQSRISALASTHEVLTRERWEHANLRDLILRVLLPLCGDIDASFSIRGPQMELPAREALAMTMALHELCTNALKHGALSRPTGHVDLSWVVAATAQGQSLFMTWQERGGPPVNAGVRTGFGSRLMARVFGELGSATMRFEPAGLSCRIELLVPHPQPAPEQKREEDALSPARAGGAG